MKIYGPQEVVQGSDEWLRLRFGKVTASELGNLLTPEFKARTGETPKTYLYTKIAEQWGGALLPGFSAFSTDQGAELEMEARARFEFDHSCDISRVGFVETDDQLCGCSPDGLIGEDGGIEIKCPQKVNHVRYLIEQTLPKDYACQVHCSLYVTQRPWWVFLSYHRGFPLFAVKVMRDDSICAKIDSAVKQFAQDFQSGMLKLQAK